MQILWRRKIDCLSNISTVNLIHHHPPKHITPGDPGITHLMIRSYQHSCHPAYLTENRICNGICVPDSVNLRRDPRL